MKYRYTILFIILGLFVFNSCEKEKIYPPDTTKEFYTLMEQWYFWKDSVPEVNADNYSSPTDLLEAMRYQLRDKWSYISTKEEHEQYYEEGTFIGYGFGYAPDSEGKVRITFVFEDSDFYGYGVRRGWIINKINGITIDENSILSAMLGADEIGVENTFEFISPTNETVTETIAKKLVKINTVINKQVIDVGTDKVGYFVFKSFIGPSLDELTETFSTFNNEGVNELVIDLRYNGGGRIDILNYLAGLIIPDNVNGKLFLRYIHNNERSDQNIAYNFEQASNSLKLNKVYFITSKGSASASEAIINGLKPYIDVYLIGNDTYGKPVGMYSFESKVSDLMYVPITFKLVNADNYGGYYDGLMADSYVEDDIRSDFGVGEATFDEVLNHIEFGAFTSTKTSYDICRKETKEISSLKDEIGAL